MSILHDYEKARDIIGHKKYDAIEKYLNEICKEEDLNTYFKKVSELTGSSFQREIAKQLKKQFNVTLLDDVLYNYEEWIKYNNWYNENYLHKKVEVLGIWHTDFEDVRCQASLYKDGEKVANIIACYDDEKIKRLINDDLNGIGNNEFAKEVFKSLIYDDFKHYINLPKLSKYSKLMQKLYDEVFDSECTMCFVTEDEWQEFYSEFTDKDFEILDEEIKKLGLECIIETAIDIHDITAYGALETVFNDDRNINSKEYERNAYEAVL